MTAVFSAVGVVTRLCFDGFRDARRLQEIRGRVVLAVLGDESQAFAGRHPGVPLLVAQPVADLSTAQTRE